MRAALFETVRDPGKLIEVKAGSEKEMRAALFVTVRLPEIEVKAGSETVLNIELFVKEIAPKDPDTPIVVNEENEMFVR